MSVDIATEDNSDKIVNDLKAKCGQKQTWSVSLGNFKNFTDLNPVMTV